MNETYLLHHIARIFHTGIFAIQGESLLPYEENPGYNPIYSSETLRRTLADLADAQKEPVILRDDFQVYVSFQYRLNVPGLRDQYAGAARREGYFSAGHCAERTSQLRHDTSDGEGKHRPVSGGRIPHRGRRTLHRVRHRLRFRMPAVKAAHAQSKYGDVWMYRYDLVTKSGEATGLRASHAFDLPASFANKDFHFSHFIFDGEPEEIACNIIRDMHGAWVAFAKYGEPDPENWPKYRGHTSPIRVFDRKTVTKDPDCEELMKVWGDIRFYET